MPLTRHGPCQVAHLEINLLKKNELAWNRGSRYTLEDIEAQIKNRAVYESDSIRPNYVKSVSAAAFGSRP